MEAKKIFSNWIVRNILLAIGAVILLAVLANIFLGIITKHGHEITVPDLTNLTFEEASQVAGKAGVRVYISDSLYMQRVRKGAVVNQTPHPGAKVKNGRRVSLTVNAKVPKKVPMPGLVGISLRQAKAELTSRGLVLGRLKYVSDIATNNVLRQMWRGRDINPGAEIPSGSVVDLVLGLDSSYSRAYVPSVKGMKYLMAVDAIHDNSLNVGRLKFDSSVKTYSDTLNAVVYSQSPENMSLLMGSEVSLNLTVDPSKLN